MHYTIQWLNCVVRYINVKIKQNWLRKFMQNFIFLTNESLCRKMWRFGMEQVKFVMILLEEMTEVQKPSFVYEYNQGAIFTSK